MIKAVFIDIDNTLIDFNECAKVTMAKILGEYGIAYEAHMFGVFKGINDGLWRDIEKGVLTREGLYQVRWNRIFAALGITLDGPEFEKRFVAALHASAEPMEGAYELLEYLSGKYIVCAASNAPHLQQIHRLEAGGMLQYINEVFTSERMGSSKPGKAFFDACFAALEGITPEETIMIGDSLTADIAGGAEYGMKTCWFDYERKGDSGSFAPDYTVSALRDICDII